MDSWKKPDGTAVFVSEDNPLPVTATIEVGDVDIGAVEIKDGTAATRAVVTGAVPATGANGLVVRVVDLTKPEDAAHVSGDAGVLVLTVRNDNAATALSDTNGDYTPVAVDSRGAVFVVQRPAVGGAALANVADSATSVTLQAANTARRGWTVFNDSISDLYVKFGATASATSFVVKLLGGQYYEMPSPTYTGVIDGIWSADSTGSARVTELT